MRVGKKRKMKAQDGLFCPFCLKDFMGSCKQVDYCEGKHFTTNSSILPNLRNGSTERWVLSWKSTRRLVLARDEGKCKRCRILVKQKYEIHHVRRRENGGSNHPSNLITLCPKCHNITKHNQKEKAMMKEMEIRRKTAYWKKVGLM